MPSDDAFRLDGSVALVTGSTRGIGAAIARELAEAGATVLVTGRDAGAADAAAQQLVGDGLRAHGMGYDAAHPGAAAALVAQAEARVGRLDVLVNNAAILRPHAVERLSETEFDEVFAVNTRAAVFLTKACLPLLRASSRAAVVNVTAACAHRPMSGIGAYCASKAAMVSFTGTFAQEWARHGIRVNAVTPGSVATDMILPAEPGRRDAFVRETAERNLMKRLGEPREIARAVRFLASPAASFVTGHTLVADGGLLA